MIPTSLIRTKVALSLERRSLKLLVVKGRQVHSWMSAPLPPDTASGAATSLGAIHGVLSSRFFGRHALRGKVSFSFPGDRSLFRTITLPRLKSNLAAEALAREAGRELPVDGGHFHVLWQPFHTAGALRQYLLVGVQKETYGQVYRALQEGRVRPRLWELKPLALVRAVGQGEAAILDLEQDSSELVLVVRGVPRLVRFLPAAPGASLAERGQRLAEDVARTVEYYSSGNPEDQWHPRSPLVLTGTLAEDPDLVKALRAASPLTVEPFVCPLACPPDFPAAAYATAVGLALKRGLPKADHGGWQPIDFNVLPQEYRRGPIPVKKAALGMALALLAVLLVPAVQAKASRDTQAAEQGAELARLQRQVALTKANLVKRGETQKEVEQVKGLARALEQERRSLLASAERVAQGLGAALALPPPGLLLSRYSSRGDSVVLEGEAVSYAAVLDYARVLEQTPLFTSVAVTALTQKSTGNNPPVATFVLTVGRQRTPEVEIKG